MPHPQLIASHLEHEDPLQNSCHNAYLTWEQAQVQVHTIFGFFTMETGSWKEAFCTMCMWYGYEEEQFCSCPGEGSSAQAHEGQGMIHSSNVCAILVAINVKTPCQHTVITGLAYSIPNGLPSERCEIKPLFTCIASGWPWLDPTFSGFCFSTYSPCGMGIQPTSLGGIALWQGKKEERVGDNLLTSCFRSCGTQ